MRILACFITTSLTLLTFACASAPDDAKRVESDVLGATPAEKTEKTCTRDGHECAASEVCSFAVEAACGTLASGVCRERPRACYEILGEVCGCDGRTYGNDCAALEAGTSVASEGECPPYDACAFGEEQWCVR